MISPRGRGLSLSAHPRRCGADVACYFCVSCPTGSSPQVRGRYPPCALEHVFGGLIPAGAGQIPDAAPARVTVPAHPRRCGADGRLYSKYMLMRGSSPQVRGRSTPMPRRAKVGRLIPAGAGQIIMVFPFVCAERAHPRRCGADPCNGFWVTSRIGSSPQVRGRFCWPWLKRPDFGLIPAGAGQIGLVGKALREAGAHPRRCGADRIMAAPKFHCRGSSPQVRGRSCGSHCPNNFRGLIPAGAGQMSTRFLSNPMMGAHPRRCGADLACTSLRCVRNGSSPQVRGRSNKHIFISPVTGLIPAGAGQIPATVFG